MIAAALTLAAADIGPAPDAPGACTRTTVAAIGTRLEGAPESGSAVMFADGLRQTSYHLIPEIAASRPGDPVRVCLVRRPRHCPAGDHRGSVYGATNLRTGGRWTAADAEHECGGA